MRQVILAKVFMQPDEKLNVEDFFTLSKEPDSDIPAHRGQSGAQS